MPTLILVNTKTSSHRKLVTRKCFFFPESLNVFWEVNLYSLVAFRIELSETPFCLKVPRQILYETCTRESSNYLVNAVDRVNKFLRGKNEYIYIHSMYIYIHIH